ncbi:MAG: UDP-2,3-diacylglucosamine diphosphatase [Ignavibacteriae bacterium]|nr:MAG: UDP-2,3-diacylglucosamine diphosphatase [Ignavibacteriota bacterium]
MSKIYFISDAHLGLADKNTEEKKEQMLINFFNMAALDASSIYILGDLFDAWFEYKTVIPKGFHRTIAKLDDLVKKNVKIHYLTGNHDFWMNNFFQEEIGINVHFDSYSFTHEGKKIFLHHGDGLSKKDIGYRILKKILRNSFNIKLYKLLHPDLGISLAKKFSHMSRKHSSDKKYIEMDELNDIVEKIINQGYDVVIMGHLHQPMQKKIGKGEFINLGDWISHFTYAVMQNGVIELKNWIEEKD